jgi:hypothetical protein
MSRRATQQTNNKQILFFQDIMKMEVLELPDTISNPCLNCSDITETDAGETESKLTNPKQDENNSSNLMAALNFELSEGETTDKTLKRTLSNEEGNSPDGKRFKTVENVTEKTRGDSWKVLQSSAIHPLWEYRKSVRKELEITDISFENESKISEFIFEKYCKANLNVNLLGPEVVFDLAAHWIKPVTTVATGENNEIICVHLKLVNSRKNVGSRILLYLADFLPKLVTAELMNKIN